MDNITPTSDTSVDASKVHGIPELAARDLKHDPVPQAVDAKELTSDKKKQTNPIILVFKAMIVAKGILRKGIKETKESNNRHERQWEAITLQVQEQHKQTANTQKKWSYAHTLSPVLQVSGVLGGQWIGSKDRAWRAVAKTRAQNFSTAFPLFVQRFTQVLPNGMELFLDAKGKQKKVEDFATSISSMANSITQGQMDNLRVLNEAEQAPLAMKSQSASSLYQNRGSEESAEKQQLSEVDRSMRDLMQQESQVFQGSAGRG